jgi:Fur family ferric uptake transcriptional regulator
VPATALRPQPRAPRADVPEVDAFKAFVRSKGLRLTAERIAVCREIFAQHGHIDAEAVLAALQRAHAGVSRATVYRNLDLLVESGLVRKHRLGQRHFVYEHLHAGQAHDHLVCTRCGKVIEFTSPGIRALQTEICRAHGFVPARHGLEISGLCRGCAGVGPGGISGPGGRGTHA